MLGAVGLIATDISLFVATSIGGYIVSKKVNETFKSDST